ncbi:MgtC/SapB family protein [Candidatus Gracilibacteria bacterium]|nr:MgtC/SapB family protein [Candidatus Gracilibacteria bacterium]MCF7819201.1 MgtC/SapB family protein [Candidatus Gracilibacteria bacterium]
MFDVLSANHPFVEFLIAAMLGAFLGLRREMDAQSSPKAHSFMGLRTMTLFCTTGAFSTFFPAWPKLPLIFFGAVIVLVAIAYAHGSFQMNRIGLTSELSALLAFWIGVLVGYEQQTFAILLTIFLAALNAFKEPMHRFAKALNAKEWLGALELLALSGAVLPFLPREPIDPWGVFVPFNVWLLVMLISGIGFLGYFLTKYFGLKGGVPLTAFLGAILSSTAVTISLSNQAKQAKVSYIFATGILIALATMQIRISGEIFFLGPSELFKFLIVPLSMALMSLICAGYFWRQSQKKTGTEPPTPHRIKLHSPFEILPALKFGLIFVIVLFALVLGQRYFGDSGVYAAAFLSGVIDVDAIVLSSLESIKQGEIPISTARNAIAIGLFVNVIVKLGYIAALGTRKLLQRVSIAVAIILTSGGIIFLLT